MTHIYDYKPEEITEEDLEFIKDIKGKWLAADKSDIFYNSREDGYGPAPTGYRKSHQIVLYENKRSYVKPAYGWHTPHADCAGGINYRDDRYFAGLFFPSMNYFGNFDTKKYELFLDWAISCGPQSSFFLENSAEEWKNNDGVLTFHGWVPGNVACMAITSMRLWQVRDNSLIYDWYTMVTELGVHPWSALWLIFNSSLIKSNGEWVFRPSDRGNDGHSSFSIHTDFDKYKEAIVRSGDTFFIDEAVASYNGSHAIWQADCGGYEGDEAYEFFKYVDNYGFKEKDGSEKKVGSLNPFKSNYIYKKNDSGLSEKMFPFDEHNLTILNSGICPRVLEKTNEWFNSMKAATTQNVKAA